MVAPLRTGPWKLSELSDVPKNGLKVFSCFHCGGGSTMGYKLAGYDVLGGVEIDPEMMSIYKANHHPKYSFLMGVQDFNKIPNEKLPPELFELDILDGSPPCSSFSTAGAREKKWGEAHMFREGQAKQVLDDLFFHFVETAGKLKPKIVVAENVEGLIQGKARGYVKEIFNSFRDCGYHVQLFLLNAASMSVPQRRSRTFFIANRLNKKISLNFAEKEIPAATVSTRLSGYKMITAGNERHYAFGRYKNPWPTETMAVPTQTATGNSIDAAKGFPGNGKFIDPITFSNSEKILFQTFPSDYDFKGCNPGYVCGMSVPPFMMQRVADQIERQLLRP